MQLPLRLAMSCWIALSAAGFCQDPTQRISDVPLCFVPNAGQFEQNVRFEAPFFTGKITFSEAGLRLAIPGSTIPLEVRFNDRSPLGALVGGDPAPGKFHYLMGREEAGWVRNVKGHASVMYRNLWKGIDVRYDGHQGRLKGTYLVAPGSDPGQISWSYSGARSKRLTVAGDLEISMPAALGDDGSVIREEAPVAWQDTASGRIEVTCRYVLRDDGSLGFSLGSFDPAVELVIDPIITWATLLGGSGTDVIYGMDVDDQGHVYVVGYTHNKACPEAFPIQSSVPGVPPVQEFYGGENGDAFVTKIRHDVTPPQIVFSTRLGGGRQEPCSVDVFCEDPFPVNPPCFSQLGPPSSTWMPCANCPVPLPPYVWYPHGNIPISQYYPYPFIHPENPSAGAAMRARGADRALGVAVDRKTLEVVVVGVTESDDFPGTGSPLKPNLARVPAAFPSFQPENRSAAHVTACPNANPLNRWYDAFVTRLTADGTALVFSSYFGGSGEDAATKVALDADGNAYVTGYVTEAGAPTLPPNGPIYTNTFGTFFRDAYVLRVSPTGVLEAATYLGGSGWDMAWGVAVGPDTSDTGGPPKVYITGMTRSSDFVLRAPFGRTPLQTAYAGIVGQEEDPRPFTHDPTMYYGDAFLAKLSSTTLRLEYSTYLDVNTTVSLRLHPGLPTPLPSNEWVEAVDVDTNGDVYVAGVAGPGPFGSSFVAKIRPDGFGLSDVVNIGFLRGEFPVIHDIDVGPRGVCVAGTAFRVFPGAPALKTINALTGSYPFDVTCSFASHATRFFDLGQFQGQNILGGLFQCDGFVGVLDKTTLAPTFLSYVGGEGRDFLYAARWSGNAILAGGMTGKWGNAQGNYLSFAPRHHPILQSGLWNACQIDPNGAYGAANTYQGLRFSCSGSSDAYLLRIDL